MLLNRDEKGTTLIEMIFSIVIILTLASAFYQLIISFNHHYEVQDAIAEMQQQGRVTGDIFIRDIQEVGYDPTGELFDPDNNEQTKERHVYVVDGPDDPGCPNPKVTHPVERILEATPTSILFLADLNGDKDVDDPNDTSEDIRYEWVGLNPDPDEASKDLCGNNREAYTLFRSTGSGGMQEVALNIESFNLSYFDEDGNQLPSAPLLKAQRESIRKIVLNLTARSEKQDPHYPENDGYRTRSFSMEVRLKNL